MYKSQPTNAIEVVGVVTIFAVSAIQAYQMYKLREELRLEREPSHRNHGL